MRVNSPLTYRIAVSVNAIVLNAVYGIFVYSLMTVTDLYPVDLVNFA